MFHLVSSEVKLTLVQTPQWRIINHPLKPTQLLKDSDANITHNSNTTPEDSYVLPKSGRATRTRNQVSELIRH